MGAQLYQYVKLGWLENEVLKPSLNQCDQSKSYGRSTIQYVKLGWLENEVLKPSLNQCDQSKSYGRSTIQYVKKNRNPIKNSLLVGETGFEPATLRSQSGCATGLRHSPFSKDEKDKGFCIRLPTEIHKNL